MHGISSDTREFPSAGILYITYGLNVEECRGNGWGFGKQFKAPRQRQNPGGESEAFEYVLFLYELFVVYVILLIDISKPP